MDINHHICILQAHTGTFILAVTILKPIDYGILDAVSNKTRVCELVTVYRGINAEGLGKCQKRAPIVGLDGIVKLVRVAGLEFVKRLEYAQCRTAAQVGLV